MATTGDAAADLLQIRSLTLDWLQSPQSSDYEWTTKRRDWFPCLHDALEYLRTFKISEDFGTFEKEFQKVQL